jgi:cyclohexanone monooxygenase
MDDSPLTYDDVDDVQREQILQAGWEAGGFRFLFETFADLLVDARSNAAAAEFVRGKIRALVKDAATAELMVPKYPIALKRPPLGNFYYESFNLPNVRLVDVSKHPLLEATEKGLRTAVEEHELDIIIFAIGFDAVTGPLTHMDVRGRGGELIRDKWAAGPRTQLGVMVDGFPNMFMVTGPQTPFANVPPVVDAAVDWIGKAITKIQEGGFDSMEATPESVEAWVQLMQTILDMTLLGAATELNSWFMGANIPGKAHAPLHYFGGAAGYFDELNNSVESGFDGFTFARSQAEHRNRNAQSYEKVIARSDVCGPYFTH